jgi:hypothetical protein
LLITARDSCGLPADVPLKGVIVGRAILAGIFIAAGAILGLYGALYLCFYGGIVNIMEGWNTKPDGDAGRVAWGIIQAFVLPEIVGGIIFFVFAAIGGAIGVFGSDRHSRW